MEEIKDETIRLGCLAETFARGGGTPGHGKCSITGALCAGS